MYFSPTYGADLSGTLFDPAVKDLHFSEPKSWYGVPPENGHLLKRLATNEFGSECSAFMRWTN